MTIKHTIAFSRNREKPPPSGGGVVTPLKRLLTSAPAWHINMPRPKRFRPKDGERKCCTGNTTHTSTHGFLLAGEVCSTAQRLSAT